MSVGPVLGADGTTPATGRQGKTGEASVAQVHGKYYESASRGTLFVGSDLGAGVATQASIGTTAAFSVHNPLASGKRISIKKVVVSYFSGTLPSGSMYHGYLAPGTTLPTSGTSGGNTCLDIGNQSGAAAVGVSLYGPTVITGKVLYPFGTLAPILATTAILPSLINEDVDGAIVLEPGAQYQLLSVCTSTGTSPKIGVGVVWEEVPIVASNG